jgi:hypothetical protein
MNGHHYILENLPIHHGENGGGVRSSASSIAAAELNVPKKAAKEFERGSGEMAEQNWDKGIQHLAKATEIYPQYASAYNDLACVTASSDRKTSSVKRW